MIDAVVFDIDNTLTDNVSWLEITRLLGASVPVLQDLYASFLRGDLPYEEAKNGVVNLWRETGNATKPFMTEMFEAWQFKGGAEELVHYALDKGYQAALITGSVDLFAETLAHRLGIPHWYANTTLVWESDELIDMHYIRDQAAHKLKQLHSFVETGDISLKNCVVVGDGDNDVETFRATGRGIAVGTEHQAILRVAWKTADRLEDVIETLRGVDNGRL